MSSLTTDPNDPRLGRGEDKERVPQNAAYLVLPESERTKDKFVRPVRHSYRHVGAAGPKYPLRDMTEKELEFHAQFGYVKYETYPQPNPDGSSVVGRMWTQAQLDNVEKGCNSVTTMGDALAETYARNPHYYGSTYCCTCSRHIKVNEFVWEGTNERVGS